MNLKDFSKKTFNIEDVKVALELYFEDFIQNNIWGCYVMQEYQIDFNDAVFSMVFEFNLDDDKITDFSLLNRLCEFIDEDNIQFWLDDDEILEIENHINNNLN